MGTEKTNELPITESEEVHDLDTQIKSELKKFNVADAFIAELKQKYSGVQVQSLEDKNNIQLMKEGLKLARDSRISVEKKRKSLKENVLVVGRAIDGEAKRITDGLLETENPLKTQKEKLEKWENEEKERKEAEEQKFLDDRVATLKTAGIEFDGKFYSIGQTISVDIASIKNLSDIDFDFLVAKVGAETERIRVEKEEAERLKKEEAERLKKQHDELEAKQREFEQKEKELAERMRKVEEAEKQAEKAKQEALEAENQRKMDEENKRLEKIVESRSSELHSIGFVFDYPNREFVFKNVAGTKIIPLSIVEASTDQEWDTAKKMFASHVSGLILEAEAIVIKEKEQERQRIIKEQEEKAAAKKAAEDKERLEAEEAKAKADALRPDVDKIKSYFQNVKSLPLPELKDDELSDYLNQFVVIVGQMIEDISTNYDS